MIRVRSSDPHWVSAAVPLARAAAVTEGFKIMDGAWDTMYARSKDGEAIKTELFAEFKKGMDMIPPVCNALKTLKP